MGQEPPERQKCEQSREAQKSLRGSRSLCGLGAQCCPPCSWVDTGLVPSHLRPR